MIKEGRLKIYIRFPYPTGEWTDVGTNYTKDERHISSIQNNNDTHASFIHQLDTTKYFVDLNFSKASINKKNQHYFVISPAGNTTFFEINCRFSPVKNNLPLPSFASTKINNSNAWKKFWSKGAAVDFSGSTDQRAFELERRIILSQYLIKIQETGSNPPQETGLTYNSWFGKPHLEMPY